MNKMVLVFLLCGGIITTGCEKDPCNPDDYEGYKIDVNLDPDRNYLTAASQTIGIIKVSVKNAANQIVDNNSLSGLGIAFDITGGGRITDWEGKVFSNGFAPITNQFTELLWFMGDDLGANQLTLSLKRKLKIERKPGFEFCNISTSVVAPVVYNATVIRSNEATAQLPNRKIFIVGDGPEDNPNFMQVWLVNNYGARNEDTAKGANDGNTPGQRCYDDSIESCMKFGPLYNWSQAVDRFNPESAQDYVLPTTSDIVDLQNYIGQIGYSGMTYYLSYPPFNLDNKLGGYFGYTDPSSSSGNMEYRSFSKLGVFWTGTQNVQDNSYASAYVFNGNSYFGLVNAKINSFFNVRLIEKQRD